MEVRLSPFCPINPMDMGQKIADLAHELKSFANIKWIRARSIRFTIQREGTPVAASSAIHDNIISAILEIDRAAVIKTSRAIYHGYGDFINQTEEIP